MSQNLPTFDLIPAPENFPMHALDEAIRETISRRWQNSPEQEKRVQGALRWKERLLQTPRWRIRFYTLPPEESAALLQQKLASCYNRVFPPSDYPED